MNRQTLITAGAVVAVASAAAFVWLRRRSGGASGGVALPVAGANMQPPPNRIVSFGYKRSGEHTHQGIDIGAPVGTPVYAMAAGTVTHASNTVAPGFSGYGRIVVIATPATATTPPLWHLYSHLDRALDDVGTRVRAGEQIGTVGATCFNREDPANACKGAHLHFEVSPRPYPQDSEASRIDPAQAFAALAGEPQSVWRTT